HDRVEDEVDEPERPVDAGRREVADGHADRLRSRLPLQLLDHGGGQVDAVHRDAALAQGQGDAAGADAELQGGAVSGEVGKEVDRRVDDRGIEHAGRRGVVERGDALVEVDLGHRATL